MLTAWPEIVLATAALLILLVYHIHLAYQVRNAPLTTSIGLTNRLRRDWVKTVMAERRDLLAVQTLRNWVMASSFLASTAILIGLGLATALFKTETISETAQALNLLGTKSQSLWLIKLMILMVDFFYAFFNFTLSIRYYNHASFAINVPTSVDPVVTHDAVAAMINHGTTHYTLGMRGYYLAVPFTLWVFGPTWMLVGAIILVIVLYKLDRTP